MQLDRLNADPGGRSEREKGDSGEKRRSEEQRMALDESQSVRFKDKGSEARPKTEMFCPFTLLL